MNRQQINAMLREILNSQNDIKEQVDTKANILEIRSNDDYYLIKNLNQLQKVLDETSLNKAFASTQEVNQILNEAMGAQRLETLYLHLAINLDDKYD